MRGLGSLEATYDYCDESGVLLFQVCRYSPKGFRQRRPDGNGGWLWNINGVRRVLYRLPELIAAPPGATIWVPEGEKDVDLLRSLGLVSTTNPGGASKRGTKWLPEYNEYLAGGTSCFCPIPMMWAARMFSRRPRVWLR